MNIKFLKAGSGDCILIQYENKNILIDGGNESVFLIDEYNSIISKEQKINLLIVTHHDDDHIKGILDLFKYLESKASIPQIDTVIFNSPRKVKNSFKSKEKNKFLSYKQSYELENFLLKHSHINWLTSVDEKIKGFFENEFSLLNLRVFSPDQDTLIEYSSNKGAYLTSDYRCDWDVSFQKLRIDLDDKSQDSSLSNETSIVVFIRFNDNTALFTGDVTPNRLNQIVDIIRDNEKQAKIDFLKLPHHGSYRSLSSDILKKIDCSNYIISTNGKKHYLPNKRALLKIINNNSSNKAINFIFNYGEVIQKLKVEKKELIELKISLKSNNENWGYGISL